MDLKRLKWTCYKQQFYALKILELWESGPKVSVTEVKVMFLCALRFSYIKNVDFVNVIYVILEDFWTTDTCNLVWG
jgi:hypothetical protein